MFSPDRSSPAPRIILAALATALVVLALALSSCSSTDEGGDRDRVEEALVVTTKAAETVTKAVEIVEEARDAANGSASSPEVAAIAAAISGVTALLLNQWRNAKRERELARSTRPVEVINGA